MSEDVPKYNVDGVMKLRLEMNNSGSWKLICRVEDPSPLLETLLTRAALLAQVVTAIEGRNGFNLRVSADVMPPKALMYWKSDKQEWVLAE